jgi:hypothetical protein
VDAPGQLAQLGQGQVQLRGGATKTLGERWVGGRVQALLGHADRQGDADQALLGAVVDVALQAAALLVLGGDDALARRPELLNQPDVAQRQAGLGGQVGQQRVLGGGEGLAGGFGEVSAPSSSPWWRTGTARETPANTGSCSPASRMAAGWSGAAGGGQDAAWCRCSPTRSHTPAEVAPVPSASTRAIPASRSPVA